tara:strand:+ start:504 stop:686 length:183 start_codon:yes stop_codon:yes gene_type:complete
VFSRVDPLLVVTLTEENMNEKDNALLDKSFDDTEEHDEYIIEKCKEIADDIRNSTDVHGS